LNSLRSARAVGAFAGSLVLTFVGLLAVTFVIGRVVPIDPVLAVVGDRASPQTYAAAKAAMGLDLPLWHQFLIYLKNVLAGDFGQSTLTGRPVLEDIKAFFPATIELSTMAILIGVGLGVPMGVLAGVQAGRWPDHLVRLVGLVGYSAPIFWLGLVALLIFYARLDLVAGPGRIDIYYDGLVEPRTGLLLIDSLLAGDMDVFWNAVSHIVLPAAILAWYSMAYLSRMTRSFVIAELKQEYVTTARVKGVPERRIIWRHVMGNAAVPLVTVIALSYGGLLEGSILTETVFAWPGLGRYITESLFNADMNAVLGGTIVVGVCYVGLNAVSDLLYRLLDPRSQEG
jgi:peptide/nickel transport system permease protein